MRLFQFCFGDGYSGSAKMALLSSEILSKKGYSVSLFVSKNSLTEKRGIEKGLNVFALNSGKDFKSLMKDISGFYETHTPDAVISHHSLDRKVGMKLKSRYKKIINIGYRHNISQTVPVIGALLYNFYFDYLIACSKGVGESLIRSGIRKSKVKIIYNGIEVPSNLNTVQGDRIRTGYGIRDKIVLGLSSWFHKERKGFDILFTAFSKLEEKFVLLITGIPEKDQGELLSYAAGFGIKPGRIFLPGYVENIWEYYKAMDIFLLPSRSEGFSLSLLEAAAAGVPVIASGIRVNKEFIIEGKNGLLFELQKPGELIEAILKLSSDERLCTKLSDEAKESVMQNFLPEHYGKNLDEFLKKI